MAAAEAEVERREARVRELGALLEDPELYTTPDGSKRAHALAAELEGAKRGLEEAFARWEAMVSAAEGAGR